MNDVKNILKPKSEEEILSHLNNLSPSDLLISSSKVGFLSGVKLALERGADVHVFNDEALRWASYHGNKNVVEFLLKGGANVHSNNEEPLRQSVENRRYDIIELLLKFGANIESIKNYADRWSENHWFKRYYLKMYQTLLEKYGTSYSN